MADAQMLPPCVFYPFFLCSFCILHETCVIRLLLVVSSIWVDTRSPGSAAIRLVS
jgi:hypothetical protein